MSQDGEKVRESSLTEGRTSESLANLSRRVFVGTAGLSGAGLLTMGAAAQTREELLAGREGNYGSDPGPENPARNMNCNANDVGYVPIMAAHYIGKTGSEELAFLEILAGPHSVDISMNAWIAALPDNLAVAHTKLPLSVIRSALAPLFDQAPVLYTYYPPTVLKYLETAPMGHGEPTDQGTRLEQLKAQWVKAGRIDASGSPKRSHTIAAASTSMDPNLKISISDLSNRIAMLSDVSGRVSLMRRDLATLMRSYIGSVRRCTAGNQSEH